MDEKHFILVVGIGNPLLKDEGVGIHVVNRLNEEGLPPGVAAVDGGTHTYDLVDLFCQAENLIIVDAMKAGNEPGTLYRAPLWELGLKSEEKVLSVHQVHYIDSMHMVRMLGSDPKTMVFGIEPGEIDWGLDLTPPVAAKVPRLVELIREEIKHIMESQKAGE